MTSTDGTLKAVRCGNVHNDSLHSETWRDNERAQAVRQNWTMEISNEIFPRVIQLNVKANAITVLM
jgi:hypothetical protein